MLSFKPAKDLGEESRDRLPGPGHHAPRRDVRKRDEDEEATRHARMRNRQSPGRDLLVSVEEKVEIQRARRVPRSAWFSTSGDFGFP